MLAELLAIFCLFAIGASRPAPHAGESHYLAKARHFWNPSWAPGDFFLESADAHLVFYGTCGWLTRFISLPAFAWCGRLVTCWLLAWSWRRLSAAILPVPWLSVLSAGLFLALSHCCQMAGEWVVGGFEAKGIAYAIVFLALEALVRDRWTAALGLLGGATAFHVLVGGWTVLALACAWLCLARGQRPPLTALAAGLALALLLALPGLVPAIQLDHGGPADLALQASEIHVFHRLRHHLLPAGFHLSEVARHGILVGAWMLPFMRTGHDAGQRRLRLVVTASLLISLAGMGIAVATARHPTLSAGLLRYYWFRLGDSMLPLGVAIVGVSRAHDALRSTPRLGRLWLGMAAVGVAGFLSILLLCRFCPNVLPGSQPDNVAQRAAWRDICAWAAANTPAHARFLTPRTLETFKWHAGRAEVVNWKDVPQDARGIVEWWRRVNDIHWEGALPGDPRGHWRASLAERTPRDLRRMGRDYGAQFLITECQPPLGLPLLYRNKSYAAYRLQPDAPATRR